MRRAILPTLVLILAVVAGTPLACAEKRVALVIGNSAYSNIGQLANPANRCSSSEPGLGSHSMRRFPAPWKVEALDGGLKIVDANSIAYVYGHADPRDVGIAKALTLDEARRIASNIAKLPELLSALKKSAD